LEIQEIISLLRNHSLLLIIICIVAVVVIVVQLKGLCLKEVLIIKGILVLVLGCRFIGIVALCLASQGIIAVEMMSIEVKITCHVFIVSSSKDAGLGIPSI